MNSQLQSDALCPGFQEKPKMQDLALKTWSLTPSSKFAAIKLGGSRHFEYKVGIQRCWGWS